MDGTASNGLTITGYTVTPFVGFVARGLRRFDRDDPDHHRPDRGNRNLLPGCRGEQPRYRSELLGVECRHRDLNREETRSLDVPPAAAGERSRESPLRTALRG